MFTKFDPRGETDPPGVKNPYWEEVRKFPGDDLQLKFYGGWQPVRSSLEVDMARKIADNDYTIDFANVVSWREQCVRQYAWAITNPGAVEFVAAQSGGAIVEIGAGTGYWAWQLAQRGIDVVAYDINPPDREPNGWHNSRIDEEAYEEHGVGFEPRPLFYPVLKAETDVAKVHSDRTLFLCWPPYDSSMAYDALTAYEGDRVIYIGEENGCTADHDFREELEKHWEEANLHPVAAWSMINDMIFVYDRVSI